MKKIFILRENQREKLEFDWGSLIWHASKKLKNSTKITIGKCIIKPFKSNPLHYHPDCYEILIVEKGKILHIDENGNEILLKEGDCITIPENLAHRAKNITNKNVILTVCFSKGNRKAIEKKEG